jgi:hypothetical protein
MTGACSSHQFHEMIQADEASQKLFVDRHRGAVLPRTGAGKHLFEQGLRIAHAAVRLAREQPQLTADELPGLADGAVPHHLPGTNDQLREFADSLGVPVEVTRGGKASLYPEYQSQIRDARSRAQSR